MNAPTDFSQASANPARRELPKFDFGPFSDSAQQESLARHPRSDGWIPERQRRFVEAIADGLTVIDACQIVHMSPSSAYAFRRRPQGAAFALGWRSAALLAREALADTLLTRAMEGTTEAITKPDGSVITRHRLNDRLAMQLLTRLDRQVESETPGDLAAAKLVAGDFDAYLDLLAADAGPARAALFLAGRSGIGRSDTAELEPLAALARADRRRREALGEGEDLADLDPAERHGWTAEQWARAETAGLIALAPPEPAGDAQTDSTSPLSPLSTGEHDHYAAMRDYFREMEATIPAIEEEGEDCPVWFCPVLDEWRTRFPLPPGGVAEEDLEFGDPDYSRRLTGEELDIVECLSVTEQAELDQALAEDGHARDTWFAALAAAKAAPAPVGVRAGERAAAPRAPANAGTQGQGGDAGDHPTVRPEEALSEAEMPSRSLS